MPTSHYRNIPVIIEALLKVNPHRLLDIGIGMGKWGMLAREYLQVWGHCEGAWGEHPLTVDGIEAFPEYIGPIQRAIYNEIHLGDMREVLPGLGLYDCIIIVDTLEHVSAEDGDAFLREMARHAPFAIVSLPTKYTKTSAAFGNTYEVHQSGGEQFDFTQYGQVTEFRRDANTTVLIEFGPC